MENLYIYNGKIITPFKQLKDHAILVRNGLIESVALKEASVPAGTKSIDANGGYIIPGFIDVHVHGGGGADTMDGSFDAINVIAQTHCRYGTTAFLPTTMTMGKEDIIASLVAVKKENSVCAKGAQISGIHLEGPFINEVMKGAQNSKYIKAPDVALMKEFQEASGGLIKIVTLAPELQGSEELISWLFSNNIVASAGHTNAIYEEIENSIKSGLSHVTHTFNAMTGLHHRKPGVVGAALAFPELAVELIADGIHVHPAVMRIIVNAKGKDKIILITDAIRATGLPPGRYDLGGQEVIASKTKAMLKDGTLAGSVLTMNIAVKNMVYKVGVPFEDAIQMATYNPAKCIGLENTKGSITPGKDADIVIMDKKFETQKTIIKGKIIYSRN